MKMIMISPDTRHWCKWLLRATRIFVTWFKLQVGNDVKLNSMYCISLGHINCHFFKRRKVGQSIYLVHHNQKYLKYHHNLSNQAQWEGRERMFLNIYLRNNRKMSRVRPRGTVSFRKEKIQQLVCLDSKELGCKVNYIRVEIQFILKWLG